MDSYRTVCRLAESEFVEKKSRFIGTICPAEHEEEALKFISDIRKKYWDAKHNVYAYVLRQGQVRRYSDDGEPQGTAGYPVLDVLLKEGLTDCAVVVTRYFGGTLLGTGGLVRAYSHSAKLAVDAGGVVTMKYCLRSVVSCDYTQYGRLAALIPESGGIIKDTRFAESVEIELLIPENQAEGLQHQITEYSRAV